MSTSGDQSDIPSKLLIVGLGNPGRRYERTRHNIGFMVLDSLATRVGMSRWREQANALVCEATDDGVALLLAKPQTFMNASGQSVRQLVARHHIPPAQIVVVSDDLDLPFGRLRLRTGGSAGGHNGLRSIIAELGTQDFPRLRLGIDRPSEGESIDWVLSPFTSGEAADLPFIYSAATDVLLTLAHSDPRSAMNMFNGRGDVRDPIPSIPLRHSGEDNQRSALRLEDSNG